ncbi:MAG: transglutaminase domain-containing protein [Ileibacterium sp.]|nr:transglutaminase domain-containing protein [Ileibacterium sp.]
MAVSTALLLAVGTITPVAATKTNSNEHGEDEIKHVELKMTFKKGLTDFTANFADFLKKEPSLLKMLTPLETFMEEVKEEAEKVQTQGTEQKKEEAKTEQKKDTAAAETKKEDASAAVVKEETTTYTAPAPVQEAAPAPEPEPAPAPAPAPAPVDPGFDHYVNAGVIGHEFYYAYTASFLNAIRNGSSVLYYSPGDDAQADYSLGEIVYDYCGLSSGGAYYTGHDANGTYLEIAPLEFSNLYQSVLNADAQWAAYPSQVAAALYSLDLHCTDREMVDQINNYICAHYDYLITDMANMPSFMNTGLGQCWHYAKLFADMCNAVGIPAWKVENAEHAWDNVIVDGVTYTFDPTYNDTSGQWTAYSWQ